MLSFEEKVACLETILLKNGGNHADSFKIEISFFFGEFTTNNPLLKFLESLNSFSDIEIWVEKLTSRIVMKFDQESEQINDVIHDYLING